MVGKTYLASFGVEPLKGQGRVVNWQPTWCENLIASVNNIAFQLFNGSSLFF